MIFAFDRKVRYVLILNCDSAPANIRLARHFMALTEKEPFALLPSRCQMHMACAAIMVLLKRLDLTSSLFCATLQVHDGHNMRALRDNVRSHVRSNLQVVYQDKPEFAEHRRRHDALMRVILSKHADREGALVERSGSKRRAAAKLL